MTHAQSCPDIAEDWSCVADFLDDIEVDERGMCRWADVANAQTHIRFTLRAVQRSPAPAQAGLDPATIEACAKIVEPKGPRPCDCERCYCGNTGDLEAVAAWDADAWAAKAIRALSLPSTDSPAQTASEQSILLDLAAKFRKEHSSVFSGNNVATALAEAASALRSTDRATGFFANLTPEQQKAALEYDGPENHGGPALTSPRPGTPSSALGDSDAD